MFKIRFYMGNDTLGYIGVLFSSVLFIPQIYHMIKMRSAESISYYFLIVSWLTYCTWIGYGITDNNNPIILSSSIALFLTFLMFGIKYRYMNQPKPIQMDYIVEI